MKTETKLNGVPGMLKQITSPLSAALFLILPFTSRLSRLAQDNPISARIIIGICHVLAVFNAMFLGVSLYMADFGESKLLLTIIGILFIICFAGYPRKDQLRFAYVRQKLVDFSLVLMYSACIALSINNSLEADSSPNPTSSIGQPKAILVVNHSHSENRAPERKNIRKNIKKKFKQIKSNLKKQKGKNKKKAILFIVLTIVVGILLSYLVAALACVIACSGYGAWAIVTLVFGAAMIVGLFILGFKQAQYQMDKAILEEEIDQPNGS